MPCLFCIRGLDLTYVLFDVAYDAVILIDAVSRDRVPGTLNIIEPDEEESGSAASLLPDETLIDSHHMDPAKVIRLDSAMGRQPEPGRADRL